MWLITMVVLGGLLLLIEGAITKTNRLKLLKHTVTRCQQAYDAGKTEYSFTCNDVAQLSKREFLYMNEFLWLQYPRLVLIPDERDRLRVYWERHENVISL